MATTHRIEPALALVYSYATGELTDDDMRTHYAAVAVDAAFEPSLRQLADLRDVTLVSARSETIREVARHDPFSPGARRAVVAPNGLAYALARMYGAYAELRGQVVEVFRDAAAAEAWLDLPPGTADRLRAAAAPPTGSPPQAAG